MIKLINMIKSITPWENVPDNIDEYAGFVYKIVNLITGQEYIGKKIFWQERRKRIPGRKNRRLIITESDWKTYESSSQQLVDDINKYGKHNFRFIILECLRTRGQMSYLEAELQFKYDVLNNRMPDGKYKYYNKNILRQFKRQ